MLCVVDVDEIKSEDCGGCKSVRCCDNCKEEHREQQEEECKEREAELDEDDLFNQHERSHRGECPICFLPMPPLDPQETTFKTCCSQTICDGCLCAHYISRNLNCPFCRELAPKDDDEEEKRMMKRVEANDPAALCQMGTRRYREGDCDVAFDYWTKAAELEDLVAHNQLGCLYMKGEGVEKDEEKGVYHLEKAAIGGHPSARYNLGCYESRNGNFERAVKHHVISANLGDEGSMKSLWKYYSGGNITKEDLDATLRTQHAAIDAMKSPEREAAEKFLERVEVRP